MSSSNVIICIILVIFNCHVEAQHEGSMFTFERVEDAEKLGMEIWAILVSFGQNTRVDWRLCMY